MLVIKRREQQWIEITHPSGDLIKVKVANTKDGSVDLVINDVNNKYLVLRHELVSVLERANKIA